jgi:cytochrome c oxidase subunit 2
MRIQVVAEPADQFDAWLQQQRKAVNPTGAPGEQVFLRNTCSACHTIRGVQATGNVGPDLTHFGSRATLGSGVASNTPGDLHNWIRNAQAVKPGVLMPAFQSLSEQDLSALVDYLESLK